MTIETALYVHDQERRLRESETRYRLISELISDFAYSFRVEPDGRLVNEWITDSFTRLTGVTAAEAGERGWVGLVHPDDMAMSLRDLGCVLAGQSFSGETRVVIRDGSVRWLHVDAQPVINSPDGRVTRIYGAARDVTQNRLADESLRKLMRAVEQSDNTIVITNLDGVIEFVNPAFTHITGYTAQEAIGQNPRILKSGQMSHQVYEEMWQVIGGGGVWRGELLNKKKNGELYWENATISPVRDANGRITHYVAVKEDITARKQAEELMKHYAQELERSNAELDQFASVVSHDLQEPLRMVSSYLALLEKRYKGQLDAQADKYIGYAVDGAQRMQNMIRAMLDYARVGTRGHDLEPTECQAVLDLVLNDLQVAIQKSGAVITHDPLPVVMADKIQLGQVFQNLIGNAIKFCTQTPQIHISVSCQEQNWLFGVRDNGIGFDPEFATQIFEIFRRLNPPDAYAGVGIGLPICKKIIERHGGCIWAVSQPGHGATFYWTLPLKGPDQ